MTAKPATASSNRRARTAAPAAVRTAPAPRAAREPLVAAPDDTAASSATQRIVQSITSAIVERRLMPGTKLAEQRLADIFQVSRTLVRQALIQLGRDHLVTLEPARGASVARPSVDEARQVFEVRRMIEGSLVQALCARITDRQVAELQIKAAILNRFTALGTPLTQHEG